MALTALDANVLVRSPGGQRSIPFAKFHRLPGDTPEGFRRTLDYALSLPASVRVYHCLVLPDALMTRGLPDWNIRFEPRNLAMTSCLGWSEDAIATMRGELDRRARAQRTVKLLDGHVVSETLLAA